MSTNNHSLRRFIREVLQETQYRVTITGVPFRSSNEGKPRKRSEREPVSADMILSKEKLDTLLKHVEEEFTSQDADDTIILDPLIEDRLDKIAKRISKSASLQAKALVQKAVEIDEDIEGSSIIANTILSDPPEAGKKYPVEPLFRDLLELSVPGPRGKAKGPGEALAILMFGLDDSAPVEPDLTIGGTGYDVKYFSKPSATVEVGATKKKSDGAEESVSVEDMASIKELLKITADYREMGQQMGLEAAKPTMLTFDRLASIFNAVIADLESLEESKDKEGKIAAVKGDMTTVVELWENLKPLSHDCICAIGGGSQKFYVASKDQMTIRSIDFSKANPVLKLGVPSEAFK